VGLATTPAHTSDAPHRRVNVHTRHVSRTPWRRLLRDGLLIGGTGCWHSMPTHPQSGAECLMGPTHKWLAFRERLLELGYREKRRLVIGVRFTQGDLTALAAPPRQLCRTEWTFFSWIT